MPSLEELFPTAPTPPDKKTTLQRTPEGYPFYGPETVSRGTADERPPLESLFGAPAAQPEQPAQTAAKPPEQPATSVMDWLTDPKTGTFPFNWPSTSRGIAKEGMEQMGAGAEEFGRWWRDERAPAREDQPGFWEAAAKMGFGAFDYATSPIGGALRSIVGQPIQSATGLPKEYSEFIAGLAIPGLGMTKIPTFLKGAEKPLKAVQKALSPETLDKAAQDAAGLIREHTGMAAQSTEKTRAALEPFYQTVDSLPQAEQWNIQNYLDGGKSATRPAGEVGVFADKLKAAFQDRKAKLQALPEFSQRAFLQDYFPHFWKDPKAAENVAAQWGGGIGRQGSAASLKQRTIPTFEEGIQRGLVPMFENPIQATMRYVQSIDNFIAAKNILEEGEKSGTIIKAKPEVMGASGRPGALVGRPDGYTELAGRGGQGRFAPDNWARIYNNWASRGVQANETWGPFYEASRKFTNAMMQSLLGFSGYHAFTMAEAGMSTELARAVSAAHKMKPGEFIKAIGRAPFSPITYAYRGKKFKDLYLGKEVPLSPQDKEIVDLLTRAGGRFAGTRHTLDYQASNLGDYYTAFKRGGLRRIGREMGDPFQRRSFLPATAEAVASNLARTLETFNKPLFQHYIPMMKNGATSGLMGEWLKANPLASEAEKLAAARRIVDSVDNRFGEMIQDNIFWNKTFKQLSMLGMLSYSWNMGGIREIGGGLRDIARTATGRQEWSPKASYVVATAVNWGILSTVYQTLKTGQAPWQTDTPILDLMAPRTGGTLDRRGETGAIESVPERIIPPGIMKDVFGYYEHPMQEVINKLNPGAKATFQWITNQDWKGDPIRHPRDQEKTIWQNMPTWLGNLMGHIWNTGAPISFQNIGKIEPGSELSLPERIIGIRTAPPYFLSPSGYERTQQFSEKKKWQDKLRHEETQRRKYQGPQ